MSYDRVLELLQKTAASKGVLAHAQTRQGRRPLRAETLLRLDQEGKLFRREEFHKQAAVRPTLERMGEQAAPGIFSVLARLGLAKPELAAQMVGRSVGGRLGGVVDQVAERLKTVVGGVPQALGQLGSQEASGGPALLLPAALAAGGVGYGAGVLAAQGSRSGHQKAAMAEDKRTAVIVKGNPKHVGGNAAAEAFYTQLAQHLQGQGYNVSFDPGEPFTSPPSADLWVGHSRGADRLQFAPEGTQVIAVGAPGYKGAINHPLDTSSVEQGPSDHHFTLDDTMRAAISSLLPGPGHQKTAEITDEQAIETLKHLKKLEDQQPALAEMGRDSLVGALLGAGLGFTSNRITGSKIPVGRQMLAQSLGGAVLSGLAPTLKRQWNRSADMATLHAYLDQGGRDRQGRRLQRKLTQELNPVKESV